MTLRALLIFLLCTSVPAAANNGFLIARSSASVADPVHMLTPPRNLPGMTTQTPGSFRHRYRVMLT